MVSAQQETVLSHRARGRVTQTPVSCSSALRCPLSASHAVGLGSLGATAVPRLTFRHKLAPRKNRVFLSEDQGSPGSAPPHQTPPCCRSLLVDACPCPLKTGRWQGSGVYHNRLVVGTASHPTWEIVLQCEAEKAIGSYNRSSLRFLCSPINLKLFQHKTLTSQTILPG